MFRRALLAAAAAAALGTVALADEAPSLTLTVGDPAPALKVEHWIKGDRVRAWEKDKIYVVEFWATWCGPCRASMPHISALQEKYKDYGVTFIGISDEDLGVVEEFLDKPEWDAKTRYTMATDPDGSTKKAYMEATLQRGIPTAYVVGKNGTLQWIGHPMSIDEPLRQIVEGTWDTGAFRASFEKKARLDQELMKRNVAIRAATAEGDWKTVIRHYDELIKIAPDNPTFRFEKFRTMVGPMGQHTLGYQEADALIAAHGQNPMMMNAIAWYIVDDKAVRVRNLDIAMKAATLANDATDGVDPAILDTLARVYWEKDNRVKAIEIQKKAVEHAPEGPMGDSIRQTLKMYEG